MNIMDRLIADTIKKKNPTVVGLDPDLQKIPACYKICSRKQENPLKAVADVILAYNKDIIDTISPLVPAVKPQMAFYEKYGSYGVRVFEQTVRYAKNSGLIVIEDAKRNDIGNTATAYAQGHLGLVDVLSGSKVSSIDADFLTVTPFLGSESLAPFIDACVTCNKGIFVLVKTSNFSSSEIQDAVNADGMTVSQYIAKYLADQSENFIGKYGYSSIGAVVGATYPEDATTLRELMPQNYFLVPGYGAQGGSAKDILPCFNKDGLGAIVNSSRGILYTHMTDKERETCTKEEYLNNIYLAAQQMQKDIYSILKENYTNMIY